MLLNPDRIHVEDLVEGRRLKNRDDDHGNERVDDAPLGRSESIALVLAPLHARRQVAVSI